MRGSTRRDPPASRRKCRKARVRGARSRVAKMPGWPSVGTFVACGNPASRKHAEGQLEALRSCRGFPAAMDGWRINHAGADVFVVSFSIFDMDRVDDRRDAPAPSEALQGPQRLAAAPVGRTRAVR